MKDEQKTKSQLIKELVELRQRITELEASEIKHKQADELFSSLLGSSPIGIYIVQDGKFQLCNPRFQQFTGYSVDELQCRNSLDLVLPEDRNMVRESAVKMLKGDHFQPYEFRVLDKNGEIRWVMQTVTSIRYRGRRATLANFMDITKLKETEKKLQESEKRYRSVMAQSADSIFIADLETKQILEANPALSHLLGYRPGEFLGMRIYDLLAYDRESIDQAIQRMTEKGQIRGERIYRKKDGTLVDVETNASLMILEGRKVFTSILRDITKRKLIEKALLEKEAQYRGIFNSATDAFVIFDFNGDIVEANPQACEMHGYSHEELITLSGKDIVHPDCYHLFEQFLGDVKTKGEFQAEAVDVRNDGTPVAIEVRGTTFNYKGKKHLLAVVRDITERKRAEEKLRESERRYRELSITDELTKLFNSRYFYEQLKSESKRALRYYHPLSLLLFDIDNFKNHNDTYGHLEGDTVLVRFGKVIRENTRETDSAYRYGGEEFTVILPVTPGEEALKVAERIRERFGIETFFPRPGEQVQVTVSGGVAQYIKGEPLSEFIRRADESMYLAKEQGKNRIVFPKSGKE